MTVTRKEKRITRKRRIRSKLFGTAERPRLNVFRSNVYIYAQLIDDDNGKTIAESSDLKMDSKKNKKERAEAVGKDVAEKAKKAGISEVIFDRGGFNYIGRVKILADAAREAGLKF